MAMLPGNDDSRTASYHMPNPTGWRQMASLHGAHRGSSEVASARAALQMGLQRQPERHGQSARGSGNAGPQDRWQTHAQQRANGAAIALRDFGNGSGHAAGEVRLRCERWRDAKRGWRHLIQAIRSSLRHHPPPPSAYMASAGEGRASVLFTALTMPRTASRAARRDPRKVSERHGGGSQRRTWGQSRPVAMSEDLDTCISTLVQSSTSSASQRTLHHLRYATTAWAASAQRRQNAVR